jgi:hypothetical protein
LKRQEQHRRIFDELISYLDEKRTSVISHGEWMLEIGRFFLGTPYRTGVLETKGPERLVIHLMGFDCATFVENVVVLARLLKFRGDSFEAFQKLLLKVRYRHAVLKGYSSRLHYFSDWIHDNQKKGVVKDVTAEIGGSPYRKTVTFMTAHPILYPPLKDAATLRKMMSVERAISRRPLYFIPKKALIRLEKRIQDGDLLAITTNREGLDVQHVGFAARVKHRIHLLHASSREGRVVFSQETLCRYLMQNAARSGIMVARVI